MGFLEPLLKVALKPTFYFTLSTSFNATIEFLLDLCGIRAPEVLCFITFRPKDSFEIRSRALKEYYDRRSKESQAFVFSISQEHYGRSETYQILIFDKI